MRKTDKPYQSHNDRLPNAATTAWRLHRVSWTPVGMGLGLDAGARARWVASGSYPCFGNGITFCV